MTAADPKAMTAAAEKLIERARALAPLLAENAAEAEQLRKPPDVVIDALRQAGIFELMVPRCYGGHGLDLDTFLEVGLALGEGDASMAWVATFYIEHNWLLCQFPASFQRALFADRSHVLAPAPVAPNGVATATPGGFRLSGRWPWATGVAHGEWVLVGARVEDTSSPGPDLRFFALPRSEVEVEDTWRVDGMAATASHDVVIDHAVVPEDRCVSLTDLAMATAPGAKIHSEPLYRTPMTPVLSLAAAMPAVGQARAAVRRFREQLQERVLYMTETKQAEKPAAQIRLARAEVEVRQAEQLLRTTVAEIIHRRERTTVPERARWLASFAFAVDQSKRVLLSLAEASGASAHYLDHPLQRSVRDVSTLACHAIFDLDNRLEIHGRTLLGLEPNGMV